ncbi:MAG TPA: aldo/keto reductase [Streptosporangiaceae bacterium]|nr:aldo/keto reductase [Streptosporangiaceae bacterium]
MMERTPLAGSGLLLTRLVFGGAPIGGLFAPVSEADAQATMEAAWAAGIRAFDTAPHYGVGLSEQRLGAFLRGRPRAEYVLSTKVGRLLVATDGDVDGADGYYGTPRRSRVRDYSRDGVLAALEASLRRLGAEFAAAGLLPDGGPGPAGPLLPDLRDGGPE